MIILFLRVPAVILYEFLEVPGGQGRFLNMINASWSYIERERDSLSKICY